ncbi:MAG TPA: hypothetical protein PK082_07510, partial [Phycisphaerae bacterium]|nr:hypothetical protein [Phycisphaerae bacterium]
MRFFAGILAAVGAAWLAAGARAQDTAPASQAVKAYVVVFDFADGADGKLGPALSDSLRLKLRRNERYEVIDRLTTQEFARPLGADADRADALKLMAGKLGANLGLYGTVRTDGAKVTADVVCLDLTGPQPAQWRKTFSDDTERARGVIATAIVEA